MKFFLKHTKCVNWTSRNIIGTTTSIVCCGQTFGSNLFWLQKRFSIQANVLVNCEIWWSVIHWYSFVSGGSAILVKIDDIIILLTGYFSPKSGYLFPLKCIQYAHFIKLKEMGVIYAQFSWRIAIFLEFSAVTIKII